MALLISKQKKKKAGRGLISGNTGMPSGKRVGTQKLGNLGAIFLVRSGLKS